MSNRQVAKVASIFLNLGFGPWIQTVLETGLFRIVTFVKQLGSMHSRKAARAPPDLFGKAESPLLQLGWCNLDNPAAVKLAFEEAQITYPLQSVFPRAFSESPNQGITFA
jgi:hypothetical protein